MHPHVGDVSNDGGWRTAAQVLTTGVRYMDNIAHAGVDDNGMEADGNAGKAEPTPINKPMVLVSQSGDAKETMTVPFVRENDPPQTRYHWVPETKAYRREFDRTYVANGVSWWLKSVSYGTFSNGEGGGAINRHPSTCQAKPNVETDIKSSFPAIEI